MVTVSKMGTVTPDTTDVSFRKRVYGEDGIRAIRQHLTNATHVPGLELIDLHGLQILCIPWIHFPRYNLYEQVYQWACEMKTKYHKDIDLLCTHAPPNGYLDVSDRGQHCGFVGFQTILECVQPKLFLFGHVHECHGYMTVNHKPSQQEEQQKGRKQTLLVNSSMCDFPTADIVQYAHAIGLNRTISEETVQSITLGAQSTTKKVIITHQVQGILHS
jgi:hypothetical protein